jgi:indolepyruvate ferredoxin oxidoreductase
MQHRYDGPGVLRGTRLDVFGYTMVRRVERALVAEYVETPATLTDALTEHNLELAREIAGLPDVVGGYERVKLRNVDACHARLGEPMSAFGGAQDTGRPLAIRR